jgi:hypothetical protein
LTAPTTLLENLASQNGTAEHLSNRAAIIMVVSGVTKAPQQIFNCMIVVGMQSEQDKDKHHLLNGGVGNKEQPRASSHQHRCQQCSCAEASTCSSKSHSKGLILNFMQRFCLEL